METTTFKFNHIGYDELDKPHWMEDEISIIDTIQEFGIKNNPIYRKTGSFKSYYKSGYISLKDGTTYKGVNLWEITKLKKMFKKLTISKTEIEIVIVKKAINKTYTTN
jgi:hypothetical protein